MIVIVDPVLCYCAVEYAQIILCDSFDCELLKNSQFGLCLFPGIERNKSGIFWKCIIAGTPHPSFIDVRCATSETTLVFEPARSKLALSYRYFFKGLFTSLQQPERGGMRLSPRMHSNTGISSIAGTIPAQKINACSYGIVDNTMKCYKIIYQNPTIYRFLAHSVMNLY